MRYLDLTQTMSPEMPVYPGTEQPQFITGCTIEEHGFKELEITMYSHTGTHIDSPAHLFHHGITLDFLPVEHFIGGGLVVDCSHLANGEQISMKLLLPLKEELARVDFVLLYTGWGEKWGQQDYFIGFPGLTPEAAQFLTGFPLKGVGIDAISVELVTTGNLAVHQILLERNIIIIENLTNLDKLINRTFAFSCLPLKIAGADGSPVRAVAGLT
ncbi:MAG: cyclase family protein [Clostridia bacterium]|jgi:kynurenine formamidase|nr:cyclase family protein [Clostridia bacterium]